MSEKIRVVVLSEGGQWIAQCLEYDVCAQADTLEALKSNMSAALNAEGSFKDLANLDPAPEHFHRMWDRAEWAPKDGQASNVQFAMCA